MDNKTARTQTPWVASQPVTDWNFPYVQLIHPQDNEEEVIAELRGGTVQCVGSSNRNTALIRKTAANTEFIIRACNAHDELVAMLREHARFFNRNCECFGSDSNDPCAFCQRRLKTVALLQRTKGE